MFDSGDECILVLETVIKLHKINQNATQFSAQFRREYHKQCFVANVLFLNKKKDAFKSASN